VEERGGATEKLLIIFEGGNATLLRLLGKSEKLRSSGFSENPPFGFAT
jgi:hypothetical protein